VDAILIHADHQELASNQGHISVAQLICERRLKSAARGGRKVQRWGWVESTLG
jgi:hypothetical protein